MLDKLLIPFDIVEKTTKVTPENFDALSHWTQNHNHLVHKRTLNHLAKLAKMVECLYMN